MLFRWTMSVRKRKRTGFTLFIIPMTIGMLVAFPSGRQSFTRIVGPRETPTQRESEPKRSNRRNSFKSAPKPAAPIQSSFVPVADAYVSSTATSTNFGTATDLRSRRSNLESYLRFDLASISTQSVVSAKLRLTGSLNDTSGTNIVTEVFSVANTTWSETGILWSNKPSSGSTALAGVTVTNNVVQTFEWDVSSFVKSQIAADNQLISLAIKNPSTSTPFATFNSREAIGGLPELVVTTTTPPAVSITGPTNNASFLAPGSITIDADATDADGITQVEFLQGPTVLNIDTQFPYSFTWNNVPIGNYSLTARATDAVGGIATSTPVDVSVVVTFPPIVQITNPGSGSSFSAPADITIDVDATDSDGVLKVDFYQGATLLGTDDTFPYSLNWTGMPACTYLLTAKATDTLGATGTSAPVTVKVTGGTIGEATPPNFKIAFLGDQGLGPLSVAALNLVVSEGAQALVVAGDLDYADNPAAWDAQLDSTVGANFPVFAVSGNHDEDAWHGPTGYQKIIEARFNRLGIPWCGSCGVQQSFHYKGIFFVFTTPGLDPLVDLGNNDTYIRDQLAGDHSVWSISSWHKNMHLMQAGGKDDETGWEVYEESRAGGAIIANGHEHSYFRTHLLSSMINQTVASTANPMTLTKGNSFVFVSGLGGQSRRDQVVTGPWIAKIYATPCLPGDTICQPNAVEGAMFGVFNVDGQPNKANFYFKDVNGQIIDSFTVISQVDMPSIQSISPVDVAAGGSGLTLTVNGDGFISESVVQFNGNHLPTTFVSNTQLSADLGSAHIQIAGTWPVQVVNAVTGGGVSNTVSLIVSAQPNPVPQLTDVTPAFSVKGSPDLTVTINGTDFVSNSVARLNGLDLSTTFVSSIQLSALVPSAALSSAGIFPITVFNPLPGGGTSNAFDFTINNPVPAVDNLSPASKTAGETNFTLTVNGTGFVNGSAIRWGGVDRNTTFVSDTTLTAEILAADLVSAGSIPITVSNPIPGGGLSNSVAFTTNNPVPVLDTILPSSKTRGDSTFTLNVNGSGFVNGSVIRWNGVDRITTFVSSSSLTADIVAADIQTAGVFPISVFTPGPGGGATSTLDFTVNNPVASITGISPNSAVAGAPGFSLTVTGNNFSAGAVVRWNGSDRPTLLVTSTELTAQVTAADVQTAGTAQVSVFVPPPGGGVSSTLDFTINTPGFEGDVAPRPSGNNSGSVTIADWVQLGRFAAGLDIPDCNGEFQRADVAPRDVFGGGTITLADWVQAGRYASFLDPVVPVGGPQCTAVGAPEFRLTKVGRSTIETAVQTGRLIQLSTGAHTVEDTRVATITLEAQGNENALQFRISFLPGQVTFGSATKGVDAREATLIINPDEIAAGALEVTLALPPGEHFRQGTRELVVLTFRHLSGAGLPLIGFSNRAAEFAVVDFNAEELAANFLPLLGLDDKPVVSNPIDEARFFVNQNYLDFLSRTPEPEGLDYWTREISSCGTDSTCVHNRRVAVGVAFFMESEFQQTGYAIYRFYRAAYGAPPSYMQFLQDRSLLAKGSQRVESQLEFAHQFVRRPEFQRLYPDSLSEREFVSQLFHHAGIEAGVSERREAILSLVNGNKTRAQILLQVVESDSFKEREYNPAFVLMQYFGYLRRDPDEGGFDFWLNVLNNQEPGNYRGIGCAFLTSTEYQRRFAAVATRSNADCGQ